MKTHSLSSSPDSRFSVDLLPEIKLLMPEFIRLIRTRLGIVVHDHQLMDVQKIILHVCEDFSLTPAECLAQLTTCRDDASVLEKLISGITIGETYFFRDRRQMELLQQVILPGLIRSKREKGELSLRIWSAGCSSGEEIYTIAMLLYEMLPDISSWVLHLLGTDINTQMLKKAVSGRYGEWSMRSIPEKYKKNYFHAEKNTFTLLPVIRQMAEFSYLNLNDDTWPSMLNGTNAEDLILCRNVLIYFNAESTGKLMKKMGSALLEGGYLLLGASDPVDIKTADLIFHHTDGLLFSRPGPGQKRKAAPEKYIPPVQPKTLPVFSVYEKTADKKPLPPRVTLQHPDIDAVTKLRNAGHWQELLDLTDSTEKNPVKNAALVSARAAALTSLGKLEQAVEFCQKNLRIDPGNVDLRLMLSMALVELSRVTEAETELRKILFHDHQSVMGHWQLGMLLLRNKKNDAGIKSLKNAALIAGSKKASDPVPDCPSLDYGHLSEMLARETEIYSSGMNGNEDKKEQE